MDAAVCPEHYPEVTDKKRGSRDGWTRTTEFELCRQAPKTQQRHFQAWGPWKVGCETSPGAGQRRLTRNFSPIRCGAPALTATQRPGLAVRRPPWSAFQA